MDMIEEIKNWEKNYLSLDPPLTKREKQLLEGDEIKSHDGMMYGRMYADWKVRRGFKWA